GSNTFIQRYDGEATHQEIERFDRSVSSPATRPHLDNASDLLPAPLLSMCTEEVYCYIAHRLIPLGMAATASVHPAPHHPHPAKNELSGRSVLTKSKPESGAPRIRPCLQLR